MSCRSKPRGVYPGIDEQVKNASSLIGKATFDFSIEMKVA
jgi:hypothetical protein